MAQLRGERVVLRPLEARDVQALRAARATPEVAAWWGPPEDDFPLGDEPEAERFTVLLDGHVAGMIQLTEEPDPDSRHAELDIFLHPRFHGRGLGTDAVATLGRHLLDERAHHRLIIQPDVENPVAIRCYEKAGFRPVGVQHASYRSPATGEWTDELLMERVVRPA